MGRTSGTYTLTSNIEPKVGAPLDARTIVKLLADLTANNTFEYPYKGMTVFVEENTKTYTLIGTDPTVSANWIESGASQVQTDWNQSDNTKVDYIKNKPENLVQDANYVHTDNNYDASAKNAVDSLGTASTKDIPTLGDASTTEVVMGNDTRLTDARTPVSHNHTVSDITDFPTLGTAAAKDVPSSGNADLTQVVMGNDTRLTDAREASDVYSWAKASTKPSYTANEISGLGTAAIVDTTTSISQGGTGVPTAGAVWTAIDNLPEPMILKGTLGTGGTITSLPTAAADNEGFTYKVITAGTYAGQAAKVGDFFVSCKPVGASAYEWIWFPSGDESFTDTWRNVKVNGTEKLGTGISSGAVDFVNGTNTTVAFDASGNKISVSVPAVSSTSAGVAPKGAAVSSQSQSTKFLREDGSWAVPSYTTNTDSNVVQTNLANTDTNSRRVILSGSANDTSETKGVYKNTQLQFTPSTGKLATPKLDSKILTVTQTGTGTAAQDKGSGVSPRYFPAKWTLNLGYTPAEGDVVTFVVPVAGNSYGVFLSINNGTNYHPISITGTTTITSHYPVGTAISVVFDADGAVNSIYPVAGGDAKVNVTGGCWRVINFYDSNSNTIPSAYCDTAAGTAAKAASCSAYALLDKSYVHVLIRYANTSASAITMNINGTGAKAIYINGTASSATNYTLPAGTYLVYYTSNIFYFRTDGIIQNQVPVRSNGYGYTPALSAYWGGSGGKYFRITIPKKGQTWTMLFLEMSLRIYSSQQHGKILLRAQWSGTDEWNNFKAVLVGDLANNANLQVYGSDKNYIYVYCNYTYVTLSVDKMLIGDNATAYDLSEISLDTVSDLPTTYQTATMALTKAGDAATVNGLTVQTAVPASAVFTDTKVTSSTNHYTPATASGQDKTASATGATAAWSIDVVKGVTLNTDGKGHVTGLSVTSGKIPANPNTDTKVTQTNSTTASDYRLLLSGSANDTTETTTAIKSTNFKANPSTGLLTVKAEKSTVNKSMLTGTGTAAQDKGSGVSPRYFPAKWTFNTGITVADGDMFTIKLPVAGHSYGEFISVNNGTNYYPVGYNTNAILTTHFPVGAIITVVFKADGVVNSIYPVAGGDSKVNVSGGAFYVMNLYDSGNSNTYDRNRYNAAIKVWGTALVAANIIVANTSGLYMHLKQNAAFDITYPILYLNEAVAANGTTTNTYDIINFATATTQSGTWTAYKPVYIKGQLSGTTFTPVSATPLTQTIPTTADGYEYIFLGYATATTTVYLQETHPIYAYRNGKFGQVVNDADSVNGYTVAKSVPSNAVFTDNNTTYTFTGGTNKFTVTPSGGTAQDVTVTPSITNNVTGSGTSGYIAKFNGANTITNGPAIGSDTTKYLRNDGSWQVPPDTISCAYCTTAAGTAAKVASCSGYVLTAKTWILVIITTANTSASALTLNINGKGAKTIYINGAVSSASNYTLPAGSYLVYYNSYYYFRTDGTLPGKIESASSADNASKVNNLTVQTAVPASALFTDANVAQTNLANTDANARRLLLSNSANNTTETKGSYKNAQLYFTPSTNTLVAGNFSGKLNNLSISLVT